MIPHHSQDPAQIRLALGLAQSSALLTGAFTGAMLLIALALVSFWKSLEPSEFQSWFATHSFRLGRVMIPLGALSLLSCLAALWRVRGGPAASRRWLRVAALALLGVVATYLVFVAPINTRFGGEPAPAPEIAHLLSSWELWHWVRVVLGAIAFAATLRACAVPSDA